MCPQDFWLLFPPRIPNISPPCARKAPHPHDWAEAADSPGWWAGAPWAPGPDGAEDAPRRGAAPRDSPGWGQQGERALGLGAAGATSPGSPGYPGEQGAAWGSSAPGQRVLIWRGGSGSASEGTEGSGDSGARWARRRRGAGTPPWGRACRALVWQVSSPFCLGVPVSTLRSHMASCCGWRRWGCPGDQGLRTRGHSCPLKSQPAWLSGKGGGRGGAEGAGRFLGRPQRWGAGAEGSGLTSCPSKPPAARTQGSAPAGLGDRGLRRGGAWAPVLRAPSRLQPGWGFSCAEAEGTVRLRPQCHRLTPGLPDRPSAGPAPRAPLTRSLAVWHLLASSSCSAPAWASRLSSRHSSCCRSSFSSCRRAEAPSGSRTPAGGAPGSARTAWATALSPRWDVGGSLGSLRGRPRPSGSIPDPTQETLAWGPGRLAPGLPPAPGALRLKHP